MKITIPGRPITKKNSQQIFRNRQTGKPFITQSKQYKQYEKAALWELSTCQEKFKGDKLHVKCEYWMPNRRSWPDLVGLLQASWDIIEKAGIIDDDGNIVSADGSRIVGIDKNNPRADIYIEEADGELEVVE